MCDETREPIYFLYHKLELDLSTGLSVEALLKSKVIRSYDIPLSEVILHDGLLHDLLGMYVAVHCNQSPWTVRVNSS